MPDTPDYNAMSTEQMQAEIARQAAAGAGPQPSGGSITGRASPEEIALAQSPAYSDEAFQRTTQYLENASPFNLGAEMFGLPAATEVVIGPEGHHGETVGQMLGGGLGATVGGPYAPIRAATETAGAIIGGTIGAFGDHYWSPPEGQTLGEHLQSAAGRSLTASALGQTAGAVIKGVGKAVAGPGVTEFIPAAKARYESFKNLNMKSVPPSVARGPEGGGWKTGMQEAAFGATAFGADYKHQMAENVSREAQTAVQNVLEQRFPGISNDYAALGLGIEEQQIANQKAINNQVTERFKTPALMLAASQGHRAADVVFDVVGNMVKPEIRGATPAIKDAIAALRRSSSTDAGFNRVIKSVPPNVTTQPPIPVILQGTQDVANRLAPSIPTPPRNDILGQRRAAARAAQTPTTLEDAFRIMGLDPDASTLTYDQLKHQMQRNFTLSNTSTNPTVKEAANVIGAAALKDLNGLLSGNPDAQIALKQASDFYHNEYVDVFTKSPESRIIKNKDYSAIAGSYITPNTTVEGLMRIEKLLGPRGSDITYKISQQNIIKDSVVRGTGEGGQFSINKYLGEIDKYAPAVLEKIYGENYPAFKEVTDRLRDVNRIYQASLNNSGTAGQMHTYSGMMNAAKLAAFAGLGFFGGPHVGANAIISAALGASLPTAMAKAWFSPKMLWYWVEGFHWTPTMKNAANIANHLATRMSATALIEMSNQQSDVQIQIERPSPRMSSAPNYTVRP